MRTHLRNAILVTGASVLLAGCWGWGWHHGGSDRGPHHDRYYDDEGRYRDDRGRYRDEPRCDDDPETRAPPCRDRGSAS